jgi:hypothetical protein
MFSRLFGLLCVVLDVSSAPIDFAIEKVELGQGDIVVGSQKTQ